MAQTEREHGTKTVSFSTFSIWPHTQLSDLKQLTKQRKAICQHLPTHEGSAAGTPPAQTNVPLMTESRISPTDNS